MSVTVRGRRLEVRPEAIPSFTVIGKMGSGKDTYSDELKLQMESRFGIPIYRPSMSAKIIELATDLFAMEGKDRLLLESVATKMREIDYCVWARYVVRDALVNGKLPFVADGIRSQEDVVFFRENLSKIVVVKIEVDELQRMEALRRMHGRELTPEELDIDTEKTVERIQADVTLRNNYCRAELKKQVRGLVNSIGIMTATEILRP